MKELKIRKMLKKDKVGLLSILKKTDVFSKQEITVAEELMDVFIKNKHQKDYAIYVAEYQSELSGYICFGPTPCTENTFDIYWIAVDPKLHGIGIGTRLIEFAEDAISSLNGKMIIVETSSSKKYKSTRKFYLARNYKICATIKDFYRKNDHKIIFIKKLSQKNRYRRCANGKMEKRAA